MKQEDLQNLAVQYATEGLDDQQQIIYDTWLRSAEDEEKQMFSEMIDACSQVSITGLESTHIPSSIKTKILKEATKAPKTSKVIDGFKFLRKIDQQWINLPMKGIKWLELSARKTDGFVMSIIHVEPQTHFPAHEHHGVEMAYILEGDLEADGLMLHAGDFFRADSGTHHGTHYSPSGCKALIVTANGNYRHHTMSLLGGIQKIYRKAKALIGSS